MYMYMCIYVHVYVYICLLLFRYLDSFKRQMENMDEVKEELTRQVSSGEKKVQAITKVRMNEWLMNGWMDG